MQCTHPDASIGELELIQNKAIRFVKNIMGRNGLTEGRSSLGLQNLQERKKSYRVSLLMRILSDYDEFVNYRSQTTMKTRAAERGEPISIQASSAAYNNSFLREASKTFG